MDQTLTAASPATAAVERETIIEFSPEELHAPFLLRFGAMLIDYMVLLVLPLGGLLYSRVIGDPTTFVSYRTLWFISSLIFIANILILPMLSGRTFGKMLTGLQIVHIDGTQAGIFGILLRQTIGYLLSLLTLGLGFLVCIVSRNGRTLHDLISRTIVVQARRRFV